MKHHSRLSVTGELLILKSRENFFEHAYEKLGVNPIDHPLIIAVHPQRSRDSLKKLAQLLFETHHVPGLYYALKPHMNLLGAGFLTGMSVVIGHNITSWLPIYDGYCINPGVGSNWLAGEQITKRLKNLVEHKYSGVTEDRQVEHIKEKCYIAENYEAQIQLQTAERHSFSIPNYYGGDIQLSTELFSAPEILFKPQLEGIDQLGLHYLINDSIISCPMDIRKELQQNIVLGGGTAQLSHLPERLKEELQEVDPEMFETCKVTYEDKTWDGCKLLAGRDRFLTDVLTKELFDESGFNSLPFPLI